MTKGHTTGSLRYRVPDHQDPTVLLAALAKHGYAATSVYEHAATTLTIPWSGRRSETRERVRGVLAGVHDSTLGGPPLIYGPVRFEDEPGEGAHAVPPAEGRARLLAEQRAASDGVPSVPRTAREPKAVRAPILGIALVRAAWGVVLVAAADTVCRSVGVPPTSRSRLVVRSLGARHVAWGAVVAAKPSRRALWIGAAVDLAEALLVIRYAVSAHRRHRTEVVPVVVARVRPRQGAHRNRPLHRRSVRHG